jgi:hypothetical protein
VDERNEYLELVSPDPTETDAASRCSRSVYPVEELWA